MRLHTRRLALRAAVRHNGPMVPGTGPLSRVVIACWLAAIALAAGDAHATHEDPPGGRVEQLLDRFNGAAQPTNGSVHLEAWIEPGLERDQVVVVVEPLGHFKLVADPGITVTPSPLPGVEWLVPLPHRVVDSETQYLSPPATVRLPFRGHGEAPVEILVEYAYCVVDYQCFFGEELLTVSARYD